MSGAPADDRFRQPPEHARIGAPVEVSDLPGGHTFTLTDTEDNKTQMERLEPGPEGPQRATGPTPTSTRFGPQ